MTKLAKKEFFPRGLMVLRSCLTERRRGLEEEDLVAESKILAMVVICYHMEGRELSGRLEE